jgi:uncharacterized CHY-type Zn-finger protein
MISKEDSNIFKNEEDSDVIICPYCGKEYEPSYEDTYIGGEPVDCYTENIKYYTCDKCHKRFSMYAYVEWKYCTETINGEMTQDEHDQL